VHNSRFVSSEESGTMVSFSAQNLMLLLKQSYTHCPCLVTKVLVVVSQTMVWLIGIFSSESLHSMYCFCGELLL